MKNETIVERGVGFAIVVPIAKAGINEASRTVRGIMTQQVVDAHDEEVDFASVVACLDTWRGNVREMHQPVAVGRAVDIQIDDANKAVEVESYISTGAEDTWRKCQDGTLGFYSIGGVGDRVFGLRGDGTRGPRLVMTRINELSLVDSGACPTATISVVKLIEGAPFAQLGSATHAVDIAARVQKAIDAAVSVEVGAAFARFDRRLKEHGAASVATVAKLQESLRQLTNTASAGCARLSPNLRMIDKPVGGAHCESEADPRVRLADDVSKIGPHTSEDERRVIVEKILSQQYRTGAGAVFVPHVR